ncbi:hypothetical protein BD770DRAFT_443430 [Pilaira anomala]|nr:hypothetical protein BD770DRAFT_443430 [Pilaira anomala]
MKDIRANKSTARPVNRPSSLYELASNWDENSVITDKPSHVLSAKNLAMLNHINTGEATQDITPKTKRNRHPTRAFLGTSNPTAQQWLLQFRKLIKYHNYNEQDCVAEFMMAMQGHANIWWNTLENQTQNNFPLLITAFQRFYGDDAHDMSRAISNAFSMKQGKEPMYIFGPKLLLEVTTVSPENKSLQMKFFYNAVNQNVVDSVMPSRPSSINEAVNIAIELERNVKFKFPVVTSGAGGGGSGADGGGSGSGGGDGNQPAVAWTPMGTENRTDDVLMDIDVNAQGGYRSFNRGDDKKKKKKADECFICEYTNHIARDCKFVESAKGLAKEAGGKTRNRIRKALHQSYPQSTSSISEIIGESFNENDLLPTMNGGLGDATSFIVCAKSG